MSMSRLLAAALLAGSMAIAPAAFAADAPKALLAKAAPAKAPLNPDGHPDLTGTWTNSTLTKLERDPKYGNQLVMPSADARKEEVDTKAFRDMRNKPSDLSGKIEEIPCSPGFVGTNCGYNQGWVDAGDDIMRVNGQPRTSFLTTPNGRIPAFKAGARPTAPIRQRGGEGEEGDAGPAARPAAAPVRAAAPSGRPGQNDNPEGRSLGERCIMSFGSSSGPVMQPQMYNSNYEFVQTKDSLAILVEMVHDVRVIRIGAKHRTDGVRPWMGDSIGHWEGNTLVTETTNFPRAQAFRGSWENLKVTEKFTRVNAGRILYQFSVEDPTLWDAPFGGEYEFGEAKGHVYEYACHEGNYALEGILAGAREDDRKAALEAKSQAAR
jgi:hypothetical protein